MAILNLSAIVKLCRNEPGVFARGEKAYQASHVQSITVDKENNYLWGTVSPSQKKGIYTVKLFTSDDGASIIDKSCTCARGQHFCHHMVALGLHAVHNISKTDVLCQWKKPKSSLEATASTSSEEMYPSGYEACSAQPIPLEEMKKDLEAAAPLSSTLWILSDEPPVETTVVDKFSIEEILFSQEFISAADKLEYFIRTTAISQREIKEVEEITRGQAKNILWHKIKKFRLSASNFGLVLSANKGNFCIDKGNYPPSLFKSLLGEYKLDGVKSIQWGIHHEKTAIGFYERMTGCRVYKSGFILHPCGFLGASPDGIVNEDRVVEVKCPYFIRDQSIAKAIGDSGFFLKRTPSGIVFNLDNPQGTKYLHQIQGVLHISKKKFCDLIIWTNVDCMYFTIEIQEDWRDNLNKLINFYANVFFDKLSM